MDANVAHYDDNEARMEKEPNVFQEFCYDNQSDEGVLSIFNQMINKLDTLKNDIADLNQKYVQLEGKYEQFTNFNEEMETIIKRMENSSDVMNTRIQNIIKDATAIVEEKMQTDATFMGDVEQLNNMLSRLGQQS